MEKVVRNQSNSEDNLKNNIADTRFEHHKLKLFFSSLLCTRKKKEKFSANKLVEQLCKQELLCMFIFVSLELAEVSKMDITIFELWYRISNLIRTNITWVSSLRHFEMKMINTVTGS